jgi:hypothetical protein
MADHLGHHFFESSVFDQSFDTCGSTRRGEDKTAFLDGAILQFTDIYLKYDGSNDRE